MLNNITVSMLKFLDVKNHVIILENTFAIR
jgi:hypothetical protein